MAVAGGSVARRYARALFGIGVDAGRFEELGLELDQFASVWNESTELRQALENPVFKPEKQRAVLEQTARVAPTPEVQRFVLLLLDSAASAAARHRARLPGDGRRARRSRARHGDVGAAADAGRARSRAPRAREAHRQEGRARDRVDPELIGGLVARSVTWCSTAAFARSSRSFATKLLN